MTGVSRLADDRQWRGRIFRSIERKQRLGRADIASQ